MTPDLDKPDPRLIAELVARYEASAQRLRDQIISPAGRTDKAREWNQARAAQVLAQVDAEIQRLKADATRWTGPALQRSMQRGVRVADQQARDAGVAGGDGDGLSGSFALLNRDVAMILARDTVGDLHKAADSMQHQARTVLRRMAATGVSNADVNAILSGGAIEGQPTQAVRGLREALRKVYGKKVTIQDKNGDEVTFDAGYYASMVATTKMREATVRARHARLEDKGIDLVEVIGSTSANFCTAYVHKVYSIGGSHDRYPPLSDLPGGGPPFHPNCSKATAPFIESLADPEQVEAAQPDADTDKMHRVQDRTDLQRRFNALQLRQQAQARDQKINDAFAAKADLAHAKLVPTAAMADGIDLPDDRREARDYLRDTIAAHRDVLPDVLPEVAVADAGQARQQERAGAPVSYDPHSGRMLINPRFTGWIDLPQTIAAEAASGRISSAHPAYVVLQEAAHALHHHRLGDGEFLRVMVGTFRDRRVRIMIARDVSLRAIESQAEFVAEVYAGLRTGRTYPPATMKLYHSLGGPQ